MVRLFILKLQTAKILNNECYQSVVMFSRSKTVARDEKLYKPFSQPQHIVVGQFSAHLIAGEGYMHKPL